MDPTELAPASLHVKGSILLYKLQARIHKKIVKQKRPFSKPFLLTCSFSPVVYKAILPVNISIAKDNKMSNKRYQQLLAIAVIVLFALVVVLTYLPLDSKAKQKTEFKINPGDGSAKVARLLAEQGLVRSRYLFIGYTLLTGKERNFKAGRYLISPSMSIPEIAKLFSKGKAEPEGVLVTIPEGSNSWEITKILKKTLIFRYLDVGEFQKNEGYLFPDTYWFEKNETEEGIIEKMRKNFEDKAGSLKTLNTKYKIPDTIIVASLLEKEVRTEEDMRLVTGIIYKRLELGMPLQIDATVAYGVCLLLQQTNTNVDMSKYRNIPTCDVTQVNLIENIKIDSPYNTYTRKGLPAGPISNPGLKAIKAALNPTESDYLYYLSTRDAGQTIFSKTAEEHQRNRAKYLKL